MRDILVPSLPAVAHAPPRAHRARSVLPTPSYLPVSSEKAPWQKESALWQSKDLGWEGALWVLGFHVLPKHEMYPQPSLRLIRCL